MRNGRKSGIDPFLPFLYLWALRRERKPLTGRRSPEQILASQMRRKRTDEVKNVAACFIPAVAYLVTYQI